MSEVPEIEPKQKQHIHLGHLGIIAMAVVLLLGLTFIKGGFRLNPNANVSSQKFTYEDAQAQGAAEAKMAAGTQSDSNQTDVAMLDPSLQGGEVLGASTGTDDTVLPDVDTLVTANDLAQIKINLLPSTDKALVETYKQNLSLVEANNNSNLIFTELSSEDPSTLGKVSAQVGSLVSGLLGVPVPKDLEEYHKFKIIYYAELSVLADGYAGTPGAVDVKETGINIFSISDKLEKIKADMLSKYGVQL